MGIPLLRAWERRYGIPTPERTASGYRLYDERVIDRVRRMRELVEAGWSPSQAARSILESPEPAMRPALEPAVGWTPVQDTPSPSAALRNPDQGHSLAGFVEAATGFDEAAMERLLNDAFAALGVDEALERFLLPAIAAVGDAWASGDLDVAAEHAASNVAMRKLAALYDAAAAPGAATVDCVVGLPPGARHEVGALAFAVACRRAGLRVRYLGADVPADSWLAVARENPQAVIVLGAVTSTEATSAAGVAQTVASANLGAVVVMGGRSAGVGAGSGARVLAGTLRDSVTALASIRGAPAG